MLEVILKSSLLGGGLAMDACAVSMANGLKESKMKLPKILFISSLFGLFQGIMPLLGYLIGSVTIGKFTYIIPWISLILLIFLGANMIYEEIKKENKIKEDLNKLNTKIILIQAIATSIDAFSVGFTISNYTIMQALIFVSIIAIITFVVCSMGVFIGKRIGTKLENVAQICGGIILVVVGIEIFIKGIFF